VFFTGALHRMLKKNPIIIVGISVTSTPRHDFSFFNSITGGGKIMLQLIHQSPPHDVIMLP
jgi:hypothetical protein